MRDGRHLNLGAPFEFTEHEYSHIILDPAPKRRSFNVLDDVPIRIAVLHPLRPRFITNGANFGPRKERV